MDPKTPPAPKAKVPPPKEEDDIEFSEPGEPEMKEEEPAAEPGDTEPQPEVEPKAKPSEPDSDDLFGPDEDNKSSSTEATDAAPQVAEASAAVEPSDEQPSEAQPAEQPPVEAENTAAIAPVADELPTPLAAEPAALPDLPPLSKLIPRLKRP